LKILNEINIFFKTKDEHKAEHRTILTQGIYVLAKLATAEGIEA